MTATHTSPAASQPEVLLRGDPRRAKMGMNERLDRLDRLSHLLDSAFEIPGTGFRIGWDTIIGLIPGIGDVATAGISAYIVQQANKLGASKLTIARMCGNIAIDATVGSVPLLGDVFDATFKANRKNMHLLRTHLKRRGVDNIQ